MEIRIREKKSLSLPLENVLFLVNHEGRVTLANFHTFVYQNKTMITFAPSFPHSVMKQGRTCPDCHQTSIIKKIKENKFYPVSMNQGELTHVTGVIPVLEGMKWNLIYLNYENGKWVKIENPAEPLVRYAGFCSPLTKDQFRKLEKKGLNLF